MPKQVFKINAFHGGLNSSSNHRDIADNELVEATDVMVDELGKVRTMGGDTIHGISETGLWGVHTPGYGLFQFSHDEIGAYGALKGVIFTLGNFTANSQHPSGTYTISITSGSGDGAIFVVTVAADYSISQIQVVNGGTGYLFGETLTLDLEDGEDIEYCDITALESGDDYLIASGDTANTNAQFDIYSRKVDEWGNGIINLGSIIESAKPCFYYVDGALRVSDGNFNNSNINKWFGYASKKRYNALSIAEWAMADMRLIPPSASTITIDSTGFGIPFAPAEGVLVLSSQWSGSADSGTWNPNGLSGTATSGSSGVTLKDSTASFTNVLIGTGIKKTGYSGVVENVISGTELKTSGTPSWSSGNVYTIQDEYDIGITWIYDNDQESIIYNAATFSPAYANTSFYLSYIAADEDWNSSTTIRISGANIYYKLKSDETEIWYLLLEISLNNGAKESNTENWNNWAESGGEYFISDITIIDPPSVITYEIKNGFKSSDNNLIDWTAGSSYKTAVIANRVCYIGNIKVKDEHLVLNTYGDMMLKSQVNKFDTFLFNNRIEASVQDGDEIIKLEEYADRILQFKKKKMHLINISQELEFLEDTFMYKGVLHPSATCKTDFGIAWVNKHGCYLYDGQKVNNLLEKGGRQIIKESEWESFITDNSIIGYIPSKRQLIILKDCSGTSDGDVYVYDMVTQSFTFGDSKYTDENTRTNFINDWDGNLTSIYTSNDVQKWSDASVESTNFSLITKDIDFGQPSQRKKIYKVYVTYTGGTSQNINVTYRTNGGNGSWLEFDGDLDSTTVAQVEAELKPNASINNIKSLQLKFDGTSAATFEINDISIVYRLKPAR